MFKKANGVISALKRRKKPWDMTTYSAFGGSVVKVFDYQLADYTKKHMRFIDRLNFRKVGAAMQMSVLILSKGIEEPNIKNGKWKYFKDF